MESATQVQVLDEFVCILFRKNDLKKFLNPSLLRPAMGK